MLDGVLRTAGQAASALAWYAGLVVFVGVVAHGLGWLLMRRRTADWVWSYWNLLGSALLVGGLAAVGYGWLAFGLHTTAGSAVTGLGLLLASAGIWMIVPI